MKNSFKFLLGLVLVVMFLEIFLRLSGIVLLRFQDFQNRSKMKDGQFVLLCLGDSMTYMGGADSYPTQLRRILNESQSAIQFAVVNKAVPGNRSIELIDTLEENLKEYKPDAVLVMIGMNDNRDVYKMNPNSLLKPWWRHVRLFRLMASLGERVQSKKVRPLTNLSSSEDKAIKEEIIGLQKKLKDKPDANLFVALGRLFLENKKTRMAEEAFKKAIELNPQHYIAQGNLAHLYFRDAQYALAIEKFKLFLKWCPPERIADRVNAYDNLMDAYSYQFNYEDAFKTAETFLFEYPQNNRLYEKWGRLLFLTNRLKEAKDAYLKSLELNPDAIGSYLAVAWTYYSLGDLASAEDFYRRAIARFPEHVHSYLLLGYVLLESKKYVQAEDVFRQALTINSISYKSDIYRHLIKTLEVQHKMAQLKEIKKEWLKFIPPEKENFNLIKKRLRVNKIPLIAVQYPLKDVNLLKEMLYPYEGVIFVDNQSNFKEALKRWDFYDLFIDADGVDYGHFAPRGARLMAENIAQTILAHFAQ